MGVLNLSRERIKQKAGVTGTAFDATIDNLIAELEPVLEASIDPAALTDAARLPAFKLGATEVACGEFLAQQARAEGALEEVRVGPISIRPLGTPRDPSGLVAQGMARLASGARTEPGVLLGTLPLETEASL